ncbi:hypothetical protein H310_13504 [Aphanomyces invadans]|uniref:Uncharacterized protein n=2 Tax=Aphanomyces invadans TaxID=157072 RepID=A0A024TD39_9STRA|nr:hypothetical protein H310_13504 [Aphanomyces invadans]ETV92085.1 hypothetical protein H310_13504 [Aphanomyces invadans]|eukprot:XP_008879247.1 hypothetical protein H310_13504 [Aphanomyces invadans]
MQGWEAAREARPIANFIDLGPNRSKIEGGATVAAVVVVENLLFDMSAKVNVGLITALEKAGLMEGNPTALCPYGKSTKPVRLSRRLRPSVALMTTCGPLQLRGVPVWVVDEADVNVALIISRPVMESLGFFTGVLFVKARSLKPEWDMSDGESLPSAEVAVNRVSALTRTLTPRPGRSALPLR